MSMHSSGPGSDLADRIRTIIAEQLGIDMAEVSPDSNILEDLGADSLDVVELVMTLEDEFDIEVPDEVAESIRTIADVERYVAEHIESIS
jgi:acyl carrier protein